MKDDFDKIRVMLVDDHRVLTESLEVLLKASGDISVCGSAANLAEAFEMFSKKRPDVVLLDLNLGANESGFTFLTKAKAEEPETRVVILSTLEGDTFRSHARSLGADDYVAKGSTTAEIVAAIRAVYRRDSARPGGVSAPAAAQAGRNAVYNHLSSSERRVLEYLTAGLSQKEIAVRTNVSASTVGTYVQRMREKFGARSVAHLVSMAETVIVAEAKGGKA